MRTTMSPSTIKITHAAPGDETWTHTLEVEDEWEATISLLLSREVFQRLCEACKNPETEEE